MTHHTTENIQPRLDYGITLYGCSTQKNIDLVQGVQNHAARLITGNFDYINCGGFDLVKSLNLYNNRDRGDYFLTILMFKAIHGIAPTYLSDRIVMNFDVNGYDTRGSDMDLSKQFYVYGWHNCGMICLSSYKILRILNHLNIITEFINVSLAHDRIDI